MSFHDQRLNVLQRMENGELSMDEAARLLSKLDAGQSIEETAEPVAEPATLPHPELVVPVVEQPASQPEKTHQRSELWLVAFVPGLLLTLSSVSWMLQGYAAAGLSWGFWLSFFPLALGVVMMWFGWEVRRARWLHLRVNQGAGNFPRVIAFSLPIPTGLMRWGMQRFGRFQSVQQVQSVATFMEDLDAAVAKDGPMHILVDDDKDGKHVELWID